jgi:hypothetical protein
MVGQFVGVGGALAPNLRHSITAKVAAESRSYNGSMNFGFRAEPPSSMASWVAAESRASMWMASEFGPAEAKAAEAVSCRQEGFRLDARLVFS